MCHAAGIKKSWETFPIKTSKSLKNNKSWSQSTHIILLQTGGRKKLLLSSIHSVMLSGSPSWGLDFLDKACSPFSSPILFDISTKKSGVWKILKKQTVIRKLGRRLLSQPRSQGLSCSMPPTPPPRARERSGHVIPWERGWSRVFQILFDKHTKIDFIFPLKNGCFDYAKWQ